MFTISGKLGDAAKPYQILAVKKALAELCQIVDEAIELYEEARLQRKLSAREVAERAGISRGLLQRIEKGNPKCEIGVAFEVATIVGVKLFDSGEQNSRARLHQTEEKLALLPKSARSIPRAVRDDF